MADVRFTGHAVEALRKKGIAEEDVISALQSPDIRAVDMLTGHFVAVRKNGRWLVVVYDAAHGGIEVITVYEVSRKTQIERRIKRGRWVEA
ncbi:DUF4258 domain-containing protein [Thermococcus stetteri]|uniref:DUF4258 domain-containing protein n=1 Tax=Thermococcus stetteri TaxID=49900 RepID=UPI001AE67660|nr:DUF4258 domain-containing protein [Thermococcus stetteri]MBP1912644.1 hypothetical protein [Thermococcus stetteri]